MRNAEIDLDYQAHLSVLNLGEVLKSLPELQKEFRKCLASFVENQELNNLESLEQDVFNSLWSLWYAFAFCPNERLEKAKQYCIQKFNNKVREIRNKIKKELKSASSDELQISILLEDVLWEGEKSLWITIDGTNTLQVYGAIEIVITAIKLAINSVHQNELRRYAIDFTWSNFIVVPLIRGKSLDATAWRLSSILFSVNPDQDLGWWNSILVEIPSDAFTKLGIEIWNHPRLIVAKKLQILILQLSFLISHIQDFTRLPELDEQGYEILDGYIQKIKIPLIETFNEILRTEIEIKSCLEELDISEDFNRLYLIGAIQVLQEIHKQIHENILPKIESFFEENEKSYKILDQAIEVNNQLQELRQLGCIMYLFWALDVVEEILSQST